MKYRRYSLRRRIVLTIVGGVLATSLAFGVVAFAIAYSMEDRLFKDTLAAEVAHQKSSWRRTGRLAIPNNPNVTIYRDDRQLPPDIRQTATKNRQQTEFYGRAGRHYHIQRFDPADGRSGAKPAHAVAVIEVSQQLFVRPLRDSIIRLLAGISLLVAIIMAVFGWWLANRAVRPLSDLARDVANSKSTIPVICPKNYPTNEIGTLAEALEHAFARIRGFVDRERTFTRDASHELRTPIAVVLGAAEVIALHRKLPLEAAEPLRRIETATTDMTLALDQLLALARESDGVGKELVALQPMVDKAISWAKIRYPENKLTLFTTIDDSAAVFVHPTSLQLVLNNLIGNCFQHVDGGQVTVQFESGCLSISDDGPGIEKQVDPFAPFAKGLHSNGSGLGLDICRRLCEAAAIDLDVGAANDAWGTHFRLRFGKD